MAVVFYLLNGNRPDKPKDALAIGFSDSLWSFTERCWSEKIASRPNVEEVVTHLEGEAAKWEGTMPPTKDIASSSYSSSEELSDSEGSSDWGETSDSNSEEFGEFKLPILP